LSLIDCVNRPKRRAAGADPSASNPPNKIGLNTARSHFLDVNFAVALQLRELPRDKFVELVSNANKVGNEVGQRDWLSGIDV